MEKKRQNMVHSALRINGINYKNDDRTSANVTPMSNKSSFFEKENRRYGNVPNKPDLTSMQGGKETLALNSPITLQRDHFDINDSLTKL